MKLNQYTTPEIDIVDIKEAWTQAQTSQISINDEYLDGDQDYD